MWEDVILKILSSTEVMFVVELEQDEWLQYNC